MLKPNSVTLGALFVVGLICSSSHNVYAGPSPVLRGLLSGGTGDNAQLCVQDLLTNLIKNKGLDFRVTDVSNNTFSPTYSISMTDTNKSILTGSIYVGGFQEITEDSGKKKTACYWGNTCSYESNAPGVNLSIKDSSGREILNDQAFCEWVRGR